MWTVDCGTPSAEMLESAFSTMGSEQAENTQNPLQGQLAASNGRDRRSARPSRYGRLLAATCPCPCCCGAFPVGACAVFTVYLVVFTAIASVGVLTNDIQRDISPNVDGREPRGTEIGKRDNTLKLLTFVEGDDANREAFLRYGMCLGHSPRPSCGGFSDAQQRRRLGREGGRWTGLATMQNTSFARTKRRRLQSADAAKVCGANGGGGCSHRQEVVFGARDGGNVLTAARVRAMCRWEDAIHAHKDFSRWCEKDSMGHCCSTPSIARTLAAMNNVSCAELTSSQIDVSLRKIARCAASRNGPIPSNGMPKLIDHEYCREALRPVTAASDVLVLAVGDGPGFNATWDPQSKSPRGGFPQTCGDFGAPCRTRGNGDWRKGLVGVPFGEQGSVEATWVASSICIGPLDGDYEQLLLDLWFDVAVPEYEDQKTEIIALPSPHGIYIKINQHYIFRDLMWAGFSFLLIYIYILASTRSFVIATCGMLHIFLSFFVTYAVYKEVLVWYPCLLWLGLFVICGIGADDIFVFVDAWKQSSVLLPPTTSLASRISWTHRRAAGAMFITSFTTAGAFLSNSVSNVVPICLFGDFMCLLVVVNYIAVIGMFPSVVVLDNFISQCRKSCRGGMASSVSIFSLETNEAANDVANDFRRVSADLRFLERFFATKWAPLIIQNALAITVGFSGLTVLVLITQSIKMQMAVTELHIWPGDYMATLYDRAVSEGWPAHFATDFGCEPECEVVAFIFGALPSDTGSVFAASWPSASAEHLKLDRGHLQFDPEFSLASVDAQVWLLNFTANVRMLPMFLPRYQENSVVLPSLNHPALPPCILEAALMPGPMWHIDWTKAPALAASMSGEHADIERALSAVALGGGCQIGTGFSRCFDAYIAAAQAGFEPGPTDILAAGAVGIMVDSKARTISYRGASVRFPSGVQVPSLVYDKDGLRAIGIVLHSTLNARPGKLWDYEARHGSWQFLQGFMEAMKAGDSFSFCRSRTHGGNQNFDTSKCWMKQPPSSLPHCALPNPVPDADGCICCTLPAIGVAPKSLQSGWFHAFGFVTTDLQETMVTAALESGAIAILLAATCLLCATRSIVMSSIALVAIVSTLVFVVGWLAFLGWRLGVLESMCMAISVGICVDFICHAAHAYSHAPESSVTRGDHVIHALAEMGVSIFSAFATTWTAAMVLIFSTTLTFFTDFGVFLAVCMVCSVAVSLVFFPAMLALVGPLPTNGVLEYGSG